MLETKEKTIEGKTYQVTQFPAMKGIKMAVRITKLIGDGVSNAISGSNVKSALDMDLGKVVQGIVERLDEEQTPKMIIDLLSSTQRERRELTETEFNSAYAANYTELFKALQFVLEVNYGGFIGALAQGTDIGLPTSAPKQNEENAR